MAGCRAKREAPRRMSLSAAGQADVDSPETGALRRDRNGLLRATVGNRHRRRQTTAGNVHLYVAHRCPSGHLARGVESTLLPTAGEAAVVVEKACTDLDLVADGCTAYRQSQLSSGALGIVIG